MDFWQKTTHPEITVLEPEVVEFLGHAFKNHWRDRPRDMPYTETAHLKHIGEALNHLRNQLKVPRERMAFMLRISTNNYTNLERLGSPIKLVTTTMLAEFCVARGMPSLARYFQTYIGIKNRKNNNGYAGGSSATPIER